MHPWMLDAPKVKLPASAVAAFEMAWDRRKVALLPDGVPRWLFLEWLTRQGYLLHGSSSPDITEFEPRTPHDLSPDDFSKRRGVFASSDALWAMMYALRDRARVLTMALPFRVGREWSPMRYFLSFAPRDGEVADGRTLLAPGFVYVCAPDSFEQMLAYGWPGLGEVREPHWISPDPVRPLMVVPITPADFPLAVRSHNPARVDALSRADPWGFPWLGE